MTETVCILILNIYHHLKVIYHKIKKNICLAFKYLVLIIPGEVNKNETLLAHDIYIAVFSFDSFWVDNFNPHGNYQLSNQNFGTCMVYYKLLKNHPLIL